LLGHFAAVLLGIVAGVVYDRAHGAWAAQKVLSMLDRIPHSQAATLAYRFGSVGQARVLLQGLLRKAPSDDLAWGDVMLTRVRLAILDGEHTRASGPTPQLAAAADACRRFGSQSCSAEQLSELARKLAAARQ